jgi:hypothetical protein
MFRPEPVDPPPEDIPDELANAHKAHLLDLLTIGEVFLRTASPTVHNELREFLTGQGCHPVTGLPAFLDTLQFTVTQPAEGGAE